MRADLRRRAWPWAAALLRALWYLVLLAAIFAALDFPEREFRYWRL